MITKKNFLEEFDGHMNSYSRFLVLNTTVDDVVKVLNEIDGNMWVGSGSEENGHVYFEVCREMPDLIYPITKKLQTIGYADIDWNCTYTLCAKNGDDFDDYIAEWEEDMHYLREEDDDLWDAFVIITDNSTGAKFHTGAGAVDQCIEEDYAYMVRTHRPSKNKKQNKEKDEGEKSKFETLYDEEVLASLKSLYDSLDKFVTLTGLSYDFDKDEYIISNVKEHSNNEMIACIKNAHSELKYFFD